MSRKLFCSIVLVVVFMGVLGVSINVHKVEAPYPIIYIRADGSIDPSGVNITSSDNVTYTFTDNINGSIVVQRSNIIIDGDGWTLDGLDFTIWEGLNLTSVSNVTIIDINIERFASYSIYLKSASHCVLAENTVIGSEGGIGLFSSTGNLVSDNVITGCSEAVELVSSSGNVVSGNNITNNNSGVYLVLSSTDNTIVGNNISFNEGNIYLWNSSENTITGNTITDGAEAIQLYESSNNTISGNNISHNYNGVWSRYNSAENVISGNNITANTNDGIYLYSSSGNSISENDITNNLRGIDLSASSNNTLSENNVTGNIVGIRAGSALINSVLVKSTNNAVLGNTIVNNTNGVDVIGVLFTTISRNHIAENSRYGISLDAAGNNTISANNITNNNLGIYYDGLCDNNTAYHNNFIDNTKQVEVSPGDVDAWDDGVEGNYWSNYTGVDLNHDGIGDSWHEIYENNIDHYPLMGPFHSFNTTLGKHVNVISNSTIESFQHFESNSTIIILVSNRTANQPHGFCRISIPYEVMSEPFNVTIDGVNPTYWNYTLYDDGKNSWIYFEYEHTTREIVIIPEFPSFFVLPLFMVATLLAVIVYKKKNTPENKHRAHQTYSISEVSRIGLWF